MIDGTIKGFEATGTPVAPEIKGYLVDRVIRSSYPDGGREMSAVEFVVMKDASMYRQGGRPFRPASAFGTKPAPRLKPESPPEADARESALARVHQEVAELYPKYTDVEPEVFAYLVRLDLVDGSSVDVMVGPSGDERSHIYDRPLIKVDTGPGHR